MADLDQELRDARRRMDDLNREVGEVQTAVKAGFSSLNEKLDRRADVTDRRFDTIEGRLAEVENSTARFMRRFALALLGLFGSAGAGAAAILSKVWPHSSGPPN